MKKALEKFAPQHGIDVAGLSDQQLLDAVFNSDEDTTRGFSYYLLAEITELVYGRKNVDRLFQ